MLARIFTALLSSVVVANLAFAQDSSELNRLEGKFKHHMESAMPGWKHERVDPVSRNENVLVEFWSFSNRKVKVSVLLHRSGQEARESLQEYAKYSLRKEELKGLGDEAFLTGYGLSDVAFRRGRLTIYVSTTAEVDADADARSLSQSQRVEREKSEMQRLSKEFARHIVNAIDAP